MNSGLRILHLEDNRTDAVLIRSLLSENGVACDLELVQTREAYLAALDCGGFDMIFSDFTVPSFNGLGALALAREKCPTVPFLFISGTLGEDIAVETLKSGATDYVLKQRLARLVPAVRRALAEKQSEQAMIQSESKYRLLFECLGEAAFLTELNTGRVLDTNKRAETLLGRTRGEIIGLHLDQFHPPSTLEEFHRRLAEPGLPPASISFEGEVLTKDHRAVPVAVTAAPIKLYDNKLILGLYRDITERKQAEERIQKLSDELEHYLRTRTRELDAANRELEIHSQAIALDLRARLRVIGDSVQRLIAQPPAAGAAAESPAVVAIRDSAQAAERVLGRLMEFRRLSRAPLKPSTLDMTALAEAAYAEQRLQCPDREIRFELQPLPPVPGDPAAIREVFNQLLANAIQFTRERRPARIKVSALTGERDNQYCVGDNGLGFPPQEMGALFEPFQRRTAEGGSGGVGMGLALAQRVIQRHGGQLWAEGRPGTGATFCFTLPHRIETV